MLDDELANRVLTGPQPPRRAFAQDRDAGPAGAVRTVEIPAADERNPQRREIPGLDDVPVGIETRLTVRRIDARDRQSERERLEAARQRFRERPRFGAR